MIQKKNKESTSTQQASQSHCFIRRWLPLPLWAGLK